MQEQSPNMTSQTTWQLHEKYKKKRPKVDISRLDINKIKYLDEFSKSKSSHHQISLQLG